MSKPNLDVQPDLTAPGLNILAAYTNMTSLTGIESDSRVVKYNIMAGTSMSCPHASAAAAYVKSFHPNWSPAAIKSALMTTGEYLIDWLLLQFYLFFIFANMFS